MYDYNNKCIIPDLVAIAATPSPIVIAPLKSLLSNIVGINDTDAIYFTLLLVILLLSDNNFHDDTITTF